MPEYLAPGVYVEEYDADPQPITGVSTSIDDATARALIERFKELLPPDWTGFNESDPGVTLANLFAWLTENLLYRFGSTFDTRCEAAVRMLAPLLACGVPKRPHYFVGQLLDAATLEAEQNYHTGTRVDGTTSRCMASASSAASAFTWVRIPMGRTLSSNRAMRSIPAARSMRAPGVRSCGYPPRPAKRLSPFVAGSAPAALRKASAAKNCREDRARGLSGRHRGAAGTQTRENA